MGEPYSDVFDRPDEELMTASEFGVSDKDSEILGLIGEEELTSFTFEGLKRRAAAHPETLSRSLDRLEELSILERANGAYRLTAKGQELLHAHPLSRSTGGIPLVRTLLPPTVPVRQVFANLKGRWFGTLRWLGYSEMTDEVVLKWVTADGKVQLDARLSEGELTIEGRLLQGEDRVAAIRASHELMTQISAVTSKPRLRRALMMEYGHQSLMPN